jgi:hypothetical protein
VTLLLTKAILSLLSNFAPGSGACIGNSGLRAPSRYMPWLRAGDWIEPARVLAGARTSVLGALLWLRYYEN